MAIEIEKPQPLMLGDKAHYTLSSYDPVNVTVQVQRVTDEDVEMTLAAVLAHSGATPENLSDSAWMAENFDGVTSMDEVREIVREEVEDMFAQMTEEQKVTNAIEALAERLQQSVPPSILARYRKGVELNFVEGLADEGASLEDFLLQSGLTRSAFNAMMDKQAKKAAEEDAALDAYAREKKLSVTEAEFGSLLGFPESEMSEIIQEVKAAGEYDSLKETALHTKAVHCLVSEASCNYEHETEEHARLRAQQMAEMRANFTAALADDEEDAGSGFELV